MNEGIDKFENVINIIFKFTKEELLGTQLLTLLAVMKNEGATMRELVEYVGRPQGSISRTIKKLSIYKDSDGKKAGYDLCYSKPSYENRRALSVHLTERGKELRDLINNSID